MERAVGLLAKHYCHDVLISLVADDCKRYTKEEQRKKERMRGGYKGSGWPLPKVREIDGDTLDETDIILWTRFVEQKKASGEPGPHCSARGGGGMSTRRPIEEMVSPDVFEKADEVTSKVMQEINWEEPVAPVCVLFPLVLFFGFVLYLIFFFFFFFFFFSFRELH